MIRTSLAVAWKDLLIVLKDRGVLAIYFLMPLLFASLLGMAFGNTGNEKTEIKIGTLLVNRDSGSYGTMLGDGLKAAGVLAIEELNDSALADSLVATGKAAAALVVPAEFSSRIDAGEPAQVTIIKDPTQQDAASIVAGVTNQAMAEVAMLGELRYGIHAVLAATPNYDKAAPEMVRALEAQTLGVLWTQVQQMRQQPLIRVQGETVAGAAPAQQWNPVTYYVPSFTVAFAFFLVTVIAVTLLEEKEGGTFRRLMASPMPRGAVIGGTMLAYVVIVFLQVLVLFAAGRALFRMPLGNQPLALLLLTIAMALAATSLGLLVGALCRNSKQAERVGMVVGFVLLALGGSVYPLFRSEGFMGILSRLTPSAWGIEGFMGLLSDNWTLAQVLPNILVLLGFAVLFFVAATWRFRYESA